MVQNIKTTPLTLLDRFNQMTFATEVSRSRAEGKEHGKIVKCVKCSFRFPRLTLRKKAIVIGFNCEKRNNSNLALKSSLECPIKTG